MATGQSYLTLADLEQEPAVKVDGGVPPWVFVVGSMAAVVSTLILLFGRK
jgi:hypothetical protein